MILLTQTTPGSYLVLYKRFCLISDDSERRGLELAENLGCLNLCVTLARLWCLWSDAALDFAVGYFLDVINI